MGDPVTRRSAATIRLRNNLRRQKESLADQFDFKMYTSFHFKDERKKNAVYEVDEVMPVMTNNYEESIMEGVKNETYSYESCKELIEKDVVQFHAHKWRPLRRDVTDSKSLMDFFLWPRRDIESIQCYLYSKWKGSDEPFRLLDATYTFHTDEYKRQLLRLITSSEKNGLITANSDQSVFLFVDKEQLKKSNDVVSLFKLRSICLYMPQNQLLMWKPDTIEDLLVGQGLY